MIDMRPEDKAVFKRLKSDGRISHALRKLMTQCWGRCSRCDQTLSLKRPAFAGYDKDDLPLVVGVCCSDHLASLATPLYRDGEVDISVGDEQVIWRYMDLAKFIAILDQGGIFFPAVDCLDDKFEGAIGLASREDDWDQYYLSYYRKLVVSPPPGYPIPQMTTDEIEREARRLLGETKAIGARERSKLVSCWHANDSESEAQWRLYCPALTVGVAIKTTVGKLWTLIHDERDGVVGKVKYVDFRREYAHNQKTIFFKRNSLSHEKEVRAVILAGKNPPNGGRLVQCDIDALIDLAVVSPFSPPWALSIVESLVRKFDSSIQVGASELIEKPFF